MAIFDKNFGRKRLNPKEKGKTNMEKEAEKVKARQEKERQEREKRNQKNK